MRSLLYLIACATALAGMLTTPAIADPNVAREKYQQCRDLLDADKPCRALDACEAGLDAMDLGNLRALADQSRDACVKKQREKARKERAQKKKEQSAKSTECPYGQSRGSQPEDKCCWSGQFWDAGDERCAGVPSTCPLGYHLDESAQLCSRVMCPTGQTHADEEHCCWPDQIWFEGKDRCLGIPNCPLGLTADGERCIPIIPDQDRDGIADQEDTCPTVPEDHDNYQDTDGCPEFDNDADGVCDALFAASLSGEETTFEIECSGADGCPFDPEDHDGWQDGDGCPDPDNDGDLISDAQDLCPDTRGVPSEGGCPIPPDPTFAVVGWTSLSLGAALAITGTGILLSTLSDREALNNPQVSLESTDIVLSLTETEAKTLHDSIQLKDTGAAITLSLGGAFLATGAVFLILDALQAPDGGEVPDVSFSVDPVGGTTLLWLRHIW